MARTASRGRTWRRATTSVTAALAAISLVACSPAATGSTPSGDGGAISGELQILTGSAAGSDKAFQDVSDAFMKKYPDVKVIYSAVDNNTFPQTKSSRLTAGNLGIFVALNLAEVPDYAKDSASDDLLLAQSGGLVDLTDEPFMQRFTPTMLDAQAIGGRQYAMPTGASYVTGVFYNKSIFADNGVEVPTTWTEFVSVLDTLKGKGVTPYGIGGKDTWPAGLIMLGAAAGVLPTLEDKQGLAADLWINKAKLDEGPSLEILEKTEKVFQYAQPNFAGTGYDDLPGQFANGTFAMMSDGTWNTTTIQTAVGDKFEIGYFPFPASDDAAANKTVNGKIELQMAIPTSSKNKQAALAWMDFFSEKENYQKFLETTGFSSAQPNMATSGFLEEIAPYTGTFETVWGQVWIANNKAGQDAAYPFNYPALAPLGTSTPQQAADAAQQAWGTGF
ncbi:hypothetical protein BW730_06315 [Tessaracoccus aquimaris]|uniref:Sugar ABC transporter substrate-binding protein n=1 Tax=Tessaracoccus aquimaris TaxID=1332264 RepID=A0A1Q2CM35_9ACTN|nr:extracellular solute-binding protein [Tessaracoccus aquimaris]AQP47184.1 hypothetical protein BW730_06315 [Tessaracoccus aquimaris]